MWVPVAWLSHFPVKHALNSNLSFYCLNCSASQSVTVIFVTCREFSCDTTYNTRRPVKKQLTILQDSLSSRILSVTSWKWKKTSFKLQTENDEEINDTLKKSLSTARKLVAYFICELWREMGNILNDKIYNLFLNLSINMLTINKCCKENDKTANHFVEYYLKWYVEVHKKVVFTSYHV